MLLLLLWLLLLLLRLVVAIMISQMKLFVTEEKSFCFCLSNLFFFYVIFFVVFVCFISFYLNEKFINYHKRCKCRFLDKTERTSFVKRSASNKGNNDNRHISIGSENHDFIGIALFGKHRYAPGELSIINICEQNEKKQKKRIKNKVFR